MVFGLFWKLNDKSGYLAGASNLLVDKTNAFLEKGLDKTSSERFENIDEMREAIKELKKLNTELELASYPKIPYEPLLRPR